VIWSIQDQAFIRYYARSLKGASDNKVEKRDFTLCRANKRVLGEKLYAYLGSVDKRVDNDNILLNGSGACLLDAVKFTILQLSGLN